MKVTCPRFSRFAELPFELRAQIWAHALPRKPRPTLCPYRGEYWRINEQVAGSLLQPTSEDLTANEEGPDDTNEPEEIVANFYSESLGKVLFEIPLAQVNHESRSLALDWMHINGVNTCAHGGWPPCHFVRHFNPARDAIYIPDKSQFDDFLQGGAILNERHGEVSLTRTCPNIACLAMPDSMLESAGPRTPLSLSLYASISVILVVLNASVEMQSVHLYRTSLRWEFESLPEGGSFFKNEDYEGFSFIGTESPGYEHQYRTIEKTIATWEGQWYYGERWTGDEGIRQLEIRPVLAYIGEGILPCQISYS